MHSLMKPSIPGLLLCVILAACGGKSDGPSGTGGSVGAGPDPGGGGGGTPVPVQSITINGTAATNAALGSADVSVKCAGAGMPATTTTNASGSYTITVSGGAAPCVVQVTSGATVLHSVVVSGAGMLATANVTQLSALLVAALTRSSASNLFNNFSAGAQAQLTPAAAAAAADNLVTALAGVIDLRNFDFLRGAVVMPVSGQGGNGLFQVLVAVQRAISDANTSVAAVSTAIAANPQSPPAAFASVPTASASCPALRSGSYWVLEPARPSLAFNELRFSVNVAAQTATFADSGESVPLTPVSGQPCRFSIPATANESPSQFVVSSSGIGLFRFQDGVGSPFEGVLSFPAQGIVLADLAGDWDFVGYGQNGNTLTPLNGGFTLAADGTSSNRQTFVGLTGPQVPAPGSPVRRLVARSDGSFDLTENGVAIGARFYAHRAPSGALTLFLSPLGEAGTDRGIVVARKRVPAVLRTVGSVTTFWDASFTATALTEILDQRITTIAVNSTANPNTETRMRAGDNRVDVLSVNSPRTGFRMRAGNSCTAGVGGPSVACNGLISLGSQDTGTTFGASLTAGGNAFFNVSIFMP